MVPKIALTGFPYNSLGLLIPASQPPAGAIDAVWSHLAGRAHRVERDNHLRELKGNHFWDHFLGYTLGKNGTENGKNVQTIVENSSNDLRELKGNHFWDHFLLFLIGKWLMATKIVLKGFPYNFLGLRERERERERERDRERERERLGCA